MSWWDDAYASGSYQKYWDYSYPSQELVAVVAALDLPRGAVALDVGCGAGREAVFLAQTGFRVIGVDLSAKALELARQRASEAGVSVDWREGSVLHLPVEDAVADFANDRGCFHHIGEADRPAYARELVRALKPGAKLLLRGCREDESGDTFVLVNEAAVARHLVPAGFRAGPLLPITLISDAGKLLANVIVLTRL